MQGHGGVETGLHIGKPGAGGGLGVATDQSCEVRYSRLPYDGTPRIILYCDFVV